MSFDIKSDFNAIQCTNQIKDATKKFIHKQVYRKKRLFLQMSISITFILLIVGFSYWYYFDPVAAITLNGDASIELQINRLDRVVNVTAYNKRGKEWCKQLNPWNQCYKDVLQSLNKNEPLKTIVHSNNDKICQKIYDDMKKTTNKDIQIHCDIEKGRNRKKNDTVSWKSKIKNNSKQKNHG